MQLGMVGHGRMGTNYSAGSWGPSAADELPSRDGRRRLVG
jgi:hypothetical protein